MLLKSGKPRLVIRKYLNNLSAQIISYNMNGDRVIVSAHSRELIKFGWGKNRGNIPSAYLVGLLIGKRAIKSNIKEAILDIGLSASTNGSRIYSALKGALDAGLVVPHSTDVLPDENRLKGLHISKYANSLNKQEDIEILFKAIKEKIFNENG